jgi:hypothetical protein
MAPPAGSRSEGLLLSHSRGMQFQRYNQGLQSGSHSAEIVDHCGGWLGW